MFDDSWRGFAPALPDLTLNIAPAPLCWLTDSVATICYHHQKVSTSIHQKYVYKNSPKKRNSRGQKVSTRICLFLKKESTRSHWPRKISIPLSLANGYLCHFEVCHNKRNSFSEGEKKICILAILHKVHSDKKWDLFEPATTNHQRFTLNQNETYLSSLSKTQSNIIHRKKLKSLGLECPLIILWIFLAHFQLSFFQFKQNNWEVS